MINVLFILYITHFTEKTRGSLFANRCRTRTRGEFSAVFARILYYRSGNMVWTMIIMVRAGTLLIRVWNRSVGVMNSGGENIGQNGYILILIILSLYLLCEPTFCSSRPNLYIETLRDTERKKNIIYYYYYYLFCKNINCTIFSPSKPYVIILNTKFGRHFVSSKRLTAYFSKFQKNLLGQSSLWFDVPK